MDDPVRIAVVGAAGRMGRTLIATIARSDRAILSGALDRDESGVIGQDAGALAGMDETGVAITTEFDGAFDGADAIVDFTTPAATRAIADHAAEQGIAHIIGTTGMRADDEAHIHVAAERTAIVQSGNMSMGVILLSVLVEQASAALDAADWDIEVLEMHHRHKIDAPSGTALLLGQAAAQGRGIGLDENAIRIRDGQTGPRAAGAIGFASLRGGSVVGDHSVIMAGPGERITLSHQAEDRSLFARGAVHAALWAHKRPPGLYSMRDVLGLTPPSDPKE